MSLSTQTLWTFSRLEAQLPNLNSVFPSYSWRYDLEGGRVTFCSSDFKDSLIVVNIWPVPEKVIVRLFFWGRDEGEFAGIDAAIARIHQIGKGFSKEPANG